MKNTITPEQKVLLEQAIEYCDANDKSTEFMLQYMADTAKVEFSQAVDYLEKEYGTVKSN